MEHSTDSDFSAAADPASWNLASYEHHPCDDLEPLDTTSSEYREASVKLLSLVLAMDTHMTGIHDARMGWVSIASLSG